MPWPRSSFATSRMSVDDYVIAKLDLTITHKEFIVLLGPSAVGKTTTLRAIAGLEINTGDILIDGKAVQALPPGEHDIAFVFQLFALYPHLTAYENIAFPLRATRESSEAIADKVDAAAKALQMKLFSSSGVRRSSSGDMQHVAIGRALVRRPEALLIEQPIGALDANCAKNDMRSELKRLPHRERRDHGLRHHDQVEAMRFADRIAIMNEGVLQQVGSPTEVYRHPANLFVAQFIGGPVMNIAPATMRPENGVQLLVLGDGSATFDFSGELSRRMAAAVVRPQEVTIDIAEGVQLAADPAGGYVPVEAHIIEPLGAYDIVELKIGQQFLRARTVGAAALAGSDAVWAQLDEAQTHFFDSETGAALDIGFGN